MMPQPFPVERVLDNARKYVKTHPTDPEGYYILGRVQYYAFAIPRDKKLNVGGSLAAKPDYPVALMDGKAIENYQERQRSKAANAGKPMRTLEGRKAHIREAEKNLIKALQLQEKKSARGEDYTNYLYPLTLAAVYEEGRTLLRPDWNAKAITYYRKAFDRSSMQTLKEGKRMFFQEEIWREAGEGYLRVMKAKKQTNADKAQVAKVEGTMKRLTALPEMPRPVTPIILSLRENRGLTDLIRPHGTGKSVTFDLDGTGRTQQLRSWPGPETAFLAWDPARTGKILSGRQLFGTATWWMFFSNGYRAMDMLDDNRDGWLTGKELVSLSLWFDRNRNGISDSGEVIPLEQTSIQALATKPDGTSADVSPLCQRGVRLNDGRILPTYDWIITPERAVGKISRHNLRVP